MATDSLFELPAGARLPTAGPAERLSPDRRRTLRQRTLIAQGRHPMGGRLHIEAAPGDDLKAEGRRCGNCWYRRLVDWNCRTYPKCFLGVRNPTDSDPYPIQDRIAHSAATDVRAWWPGCTEHTYGDPKLSEDAARHVPEPVTS